MIERRIQYTRDSGEKLDVGAVTWDFEGTITRLDLDKLHWYGHMTVAERLLGIKLDLEDEQTFINIPHLIGGPDVAVMDDLKNYAIRINKIPKRVPSIDEMLKLKKEVYFGMISDLPAENFKIDPDFIKFVEAVKAEGIPTALGTLTEANTVYILLGKSGLASLFSYRPVTELIVWESVSHVKPDPQVYYATAGRLKIIPTEQMVLGDSHNDMAAAKNAGSIPIGMPTKQSQEIYNRLRDNGAVEIYPGWHEVNQDAKKLLNIEIK
jgi:beta-phosphoglucomutase-like phosphatase (HAD superfamily)